MIFIVDNELKQVDKELEIFSSGYKGNVYEYGFDAFLFGVDGDVSVLRNLTEVHYLFDKDAVALESDIHGSGMTWNFKQRSTKLLVVKKSLKISDNLG